MNIYDISEKAGVSIATVSRVLNNSSNVSQKTRDKVLQVINDTGYTPNAFARGLGLNTMRTIGILCADSSDAYLASAVYYLEQCLRQHNYDSLLCCTGYDRQTKSKYMDLLLSKRVDAIILVGSNFVELDSKQNEYIRQAASEIPVVILGGYIDAPNIYCISCDDCSAIYKATHFLLQKGCRHPVYFGRLLSYGGLQKMNGYKMAMKEAGFSDDAIRTLQINADIVQARERIARFYEEAPFDGVLTADDELAVGALKFARGAGLRIPEDISIIGYNNSSLGLCCEPELTTMDNQVSEISETAVEILMKVLDKRNPATRTFFPAKMVLRGSTPT